MFLTTEGIFGVPLGVSTGFVFLFVLFGSLLDKAGAGEYFINLAFAMLGTISEVDQLKLPLLLLDLLELCQVLLLQIQ